MLRSTANRPERRGLQRQCFYHGLRPIYPPSLNDHPLMPERPVEREQADRAMTRTIRDLLDKLRTQCQREQEAHEWVDRAHPWH
eukprot:7540942-Pyramimonas_sp.AAC.1